MRTLVLVQLLVPIVTLTAALVGFRYYQKLRRSNWSVFPFYLFFVGTMDLLGHFVKNQDQNARYYNYFVFPIQAICLIFLFYRSSKIESHQKIMLLLLLATFLSYLVFGIIYVDNLALMGIIYNGNCIATFFVIIILYFIELFSTDRILYFQEDLRFWVSVGLITYYLLTFPYYTFRHFIFTSNITYAMPMFYTANFLSMLMYIVFIIGIIKSKDQRDDL